MKASIVEAGFIVALEDGTELFAQVILDHNVVVVDPDNESETEKCINSLLNISVKRINTDLQDEDYLNQIREQLKDTEGQCSLTTINVKNRYNDPTELE